jgi:hypothetical protein
VWNCSDLQGRRRRSSDTRLRIDFKDAKEACRCVMLVSNLRSPKFWRLRHQYPPIWLQPRWLLLILATSRIPPVDRPHIEKWIGLRALKTLWNKVVFFVRFTQGQPTLIFYNTITWIASEQAHLPPANPVGKGEHNSEDLLVRRAAHLCDRILISLVAPVFFTASPWPPTAARSTSHPRTARARSAQMAMSTPYHTTLHASAHTQT